MQQIRDIVSSEFEAVNQLIIEQLHSDVPLVENIGHYIVDAGGKRLRPMLTLLTGGACGEITPNHIKLAAVIEFIHTATLLHDDVVDISSLRRGRPTANAKWGNAPSVLVGDFLYSRAFQILVSIGNMELMALIADVTNTIAEGEVLQLTKAGDPNTTEAEYFDVIKNKTAVLFAAAASGGVILSETHSHKADLFYEYGLNLGIAFQLVDDVLDYEGDADSMGKNVGDDLAEGKPTLPLIYTGQHGNSEQKQLIHSAITNKSIDQLDKVIAATQASGAIQYTKDKALQFSSLAKQSAELLNQNTYQKALIELAEIAVSRQA